MIWPLSILTLAVAQVWPSMILTIQPLPILQMRSRPSKVSSMAQILTFSTLKRCSAPSPLTASALTGTHWWISASIKQVRSMRKSANSSTTTACNSISTSKSMKSWGSPSRRPRSTSGRVFSASFSISLRFTHSKMASCQSWRRHSPELNPRAPPPQEKKKRPPLLLQILLKHWKKMMMWQVLMKMD